VHRNPNKNANRSPIRYFGTDIQITSPFYLLTFIEAQSTNSNMATKGGYTVGCISMLTYRI
jgi:hypothetical protein